MDNPALDTSGSTALATATEPTRAADAIVDMLVAHGVEVIFGLPGGPISPLLDALLDRPEIQVINTRSEGAAMFAAAILTKTVTATLPAALLMIIWWQSGRTPDAIAEFKTTLRYNPNHAEARCACRCALRVRTIYRGGCGVHPNHAAQSKLGGGTR